ncbi:helix-turn-helix domain-containing protein [Pseudonocardia sp. McavD-2-B]|uniref:helix-turn-helix domain-containing protein n=1 Tax=Pseudonocardia sp. McavD-2-B TaxID=2954499 RepID=UPI002097BF1C|nr:helix-turn-helix domain-containing protein [Pseudonocardia sp. McavD-2-B]MCO7192296.1 helix-turn-helix domain-containing protein [Pseudonocardia sp. McavD-2-B]
MSQPDGATQDGSTPPRVAYTPTEVASRLGLSEWSVRRLIRSGQLRATRVGRRWVVPVAAVTAFVNGSAQD